MKLKSGALGAAVIAVTLLSGCSDEPSAGDIKDNYREIYKNCPIMKISDVKKLNGRPGEGKDYIVDVSFTITMTPPKENASIPEQSKKEADALSADLDAVRSKHEEATRMMNELEAAAARIPVESPEYDAAIMRAVKAGEQRHELMMQYNELIMRRENLQPDSLAVRSKMGANIVKQCVIPKPWIGLSRLEDFVSLLPGNKSLYTETQKTFTGQFHMVKTEKGWMISDMLRR